MLIAVAAAVAAPQSNRAGNPLHNQSVRDPVPQFEAGAQKIAFLNAFQTLLANDANDRNLILYSLK